MGGTHSRTLTIETGVLCNNRCVFCYQKALRTVRGFPQLVPGDEVRARIRWGAENGYDELSLTGGEPTVRPDFLDLVRFAREQGMRRVAITTNGWRLARPEVFVAAAEAGLTSMGVSVHGATAEQHDALTGHEGSWLRALQTIRNALATRGTSRIVRVNTFTVVNRLNHGRLVDLADVLRNLGVRLMVLQPTILSKSNFEDAAAVALDLPDLVAAIRAVALRGIERGFRVKLFNMPPCLFRDVLAGVEIDHYERATWKEHDDGAGAFAEEPGYVRLDACAGCALTRICPGLHVTLLPQEDLAAHMEDCIAAFSAGDRHRVWVAGTDLLTPEGLGRVVRKARLGGFEEVTLATGGSHRGGRRALEAAVAAGVSEVVLVHHARDPGSGDRILCHAGNDRFLARTAADLAEVVAGRDVRAGVLVNPDQAGLDFLLSDGLRSLAGVPPALRLRTPWREGGPSWEIGMVARFLAEVTRLPFRPAETVFHVPWPTPLEAAVQLPAAAVLALGAARFDLVSAVLPTALLAPANSVVNWSGPCLGHDRTDRWTGGLPVPALKSRAVRARPVTREALQAAVAAQAQQHTPPGGPPPGPPGARPAPGGPPRPTPARRP